MFPQISTLEQKLSPSVIQQFHLTDLNPNRQARRVKRKNLIYSSFIVKHNVLWKIVAFRRSKWQQPS